MESRIDRVMYVVTLGLMMALLIAMRRVGETPIPWSLFDTILLVTAAAAAVLMGRRITQGMPELRQYRQALRAEQATAQEMGTALAGDNRLIHDVQAGEFNIDHAVITPAGIFAVETKSRLKPPTGNGAPKVKYDGKILDFGTWHETKPLEQAERQARWLEDYLKRSTGEFYPVTPVLALPGWFIETTVRPTQGMVRVINPKNCQWLLLPPKQAARLDPAAIQRAAFQIEKLAQAPQENQSSSH